MEKTIKKTKTNIDGSVSIWAELPAVPIASGLKHGKYIRYFPDSTTIWFDNNYNQGEADGMQREFYPDGKLARCETYSNGKKVGTWKRRYKNGQLELKYNYSMTGNELFDGKFEEWYEDGTRKLTKTYSNGKLTGKFKIWYSNGQLWYKRYYSMSGDELLDGKFEEWYEDGTRKCTKTYSNGNIFGKSKRWYSNGNIQYKWYYNENEKREGLQFEYYLNGNLRLCSNYVGGNKVGMTVEWHDDGNVKMVYSADGILYSN